MPGQSIPDTTQDRSTDDMKIENDRLKTTLMILTQKLKLKEDDVKGQDERWQSQIKQL